MSSQARMTAIRLGCEGFAKGDRVRVLYYPDQPGTVVSAERLWCYVRFDRSPGRHFYGNAVVTLEDNDDEQEG